jgi:excisionase family DNA binding protein
MFEHDPITVHVGEACRLSGLSRPTVYRLLGKGAFLAVKAGGRTLVRLDSLRAYLNSLPATKIKVGQRGAPAAVGDQPRA